jgi:hypothetical protein
MNGVETTVTPGSSNITEFSYDPSTETLRVVFNSGGEYDYFNVPQSTHRMFQAAASKGEFLNRHIKGRFAYERS